MTDPRPKWAEAIRVFVTDTVLDAEYAYPMDPTDESADELLDEIQHTVLDIFCRAYGHDIIDDQCGIPAHRFCVYCGQLCPSEEGA